MSKRWWLDSSRGAIMQHVSTRMLMLQIPGCFGQPGQDIYDDFIGLLLFYLKVFN